VCGFDEYSSYFCFDYFMYISSSFNCHSLLFVPSLHVFRNVHIWLFVCWCFSVCILRYVCNMCWVVFYVCLPFLLFICCCSFLLTFFCSFSFVYVRISLFGSLCYYVYPRLLSKHLLIMWLFVLIVFSSVSFPSFYSVLGFIWLWLLSFVHCFESSILLFDVFLLIYSFLFLRFLLFYSSLWLYLLHLFGILLVSAAVW